MALILGLCSKLIVRYNASHPLCNSFALMQRLNFFCTIAKNYRESVVFFIEFVLFYLAINSSHVHTR
jgi:hypothetical protein